MNQYQNSLLYMKTLVFGEIKCILAKEPHSICETWRRKYHSLGQCCWIWDGTMKVGFTAHSPLFLRLERNVLISFWTSWSLLSPCDTSLFLIRIDENKSSLLEDSEQMLSENTPSDSLRPFRDTCCSKEGRSCPAPHGSELTDAHRTPCMLVLLPSVEDSGAAWLNVELELNSPSDTGLCLRGPSRLGLLENKDW